MDVVTILLFVFCMILLMYVSIQGGTGWVLFKAKFPFIWKSKGAWYIKAYDSQNVEVDFDVYKDKIVWDKTNEDITQIDRAYSKNKYGFPILFGIQGEAANFDPFANITPMRAGPWYAQLLTRAMNLGELKAKKADKNTELFIKIILLASLASIVLLIWIIVQNSATVELVTQVKTFWAEHGSLIQDWIKTQTANKVI